MSNFHRNVDLGAVIFLARVGGIVAPQLLQLVRKISVHPLISIFRDYSYSHSQLNFQFHFLANRIHPYLNNFDLRRSSFYLTVLVNLSI